MTVVQKKKKKKYVGKQKPMIVSHYFGYRETFFLLWRNYFSPVYLKLN